MLNVFEGVVKVDSQGAYLSVSHQHKAQLELDLLSPGLRIPGDLTAKFPIQAGDVVKVSLGHNTKTNDGHVHPRVYVESILEHRQPEVTL